MVKSIAAIFVISALCVPISGSAQTTKSSAPPVSAPVGQATEKHIDDSFCSKDPEAVIRAYCKYLAKFQSGVNDKSYSNVDNASDALDKLDLTEPSATNDFITAIAATLAANTAISKAMASSALRDAGQSRPDQQMSASGNASGTTSLVSKAGSSELLSLALDTGVLTRSVNGTTVTLGTNADQVFRMITGSDPDCTATCNDLGWIESGILNRTNIIATFDLAQQSSTTTTTTGQASGTTPIQVGNAAIPTGAGRLSGIEARYQVRNRFDPRDGDFKKKWKQAVADNAGLKTAVTTLGDAVQRVEEILTGSATVLKRDEMIQTAQKDPTGAALVTYFRSYFSSASGSAIQDPALIDGVSQVMQDRTVFRQAWYQTLDQAVGTLFTFDYSYNQAINQPETHDFKLIFARDFQTMGMLTFNGTVSIYGTIPSGAQYGRIHDGQISGQYDRTLTGKDKAVQTQLSLAGYWQYQPNPSILNIAAGTVVPGTMIPLPNGTQEFVGTAGSLWVAQAKVTIKASGGINIPIAVSWSNKTDLLQGNKVGAQVGISYNFSSLAGLFTGGGSQ